MILKNLVVLCIVFSYYGFVTENQEIDDRDELIKYAESYLGTPHKSKARNGFDCSGFTKHCYKHLGINIPSSSKDQLKIGNQVTSADGLKGDIIVFTGTNSKRERAGHVGMIHHISQDTIYFIHVSSSQGVTINHNLQPYYKKRLLGIRQARFLKPCLSDT